MAIGGSGSAAQQRQHVHHAEAARTQRIASAQQIIARLRPKLDKVEGARLFMQAAQDVRLGGRPTRTQFEFTLQDADLAELNEWAPKILTKMQTLPELRDVATDQQTNGTTLELKINRDTARALRHPAAADRRHAVRRVRPAPGHAVFHPAQQLSRDPGDPARDCRATSTRSNKIYIKSPTTGDQVPLSTFATWTSVPVRPLSISHQGQFPAVTISFNLAQGAALGQATDAVQKAMVDLGAPATLSSSFQGTAQAFQQCARHRAAADPGGAGRGLSDPRHPL